MKPKKQKPRMVHLYWIDAVADSEWTEFDKADDIHVCETIGFLIKETKLGLVVASTISGDECNARITIPKAWVRKKRYVKI